MSRQKHTSEALCSYTTTSFHNIFFPDSMLRRVEMSHDGNSWTGLHSLTSQSIFQDVATVITLI